MGDSYNHGKREIVQTTTIVKIFEIAKIVKRKGAQRAKKLLEKRNCVNLIGNINVSSMSGTILCEGLFQLGNQVLNALSTYRH